MTTPTPQENVLVLKLPEVDRVFAFVNVKPVPGQAGLPYPGFKGDLRAATLTSFPAEVKLPPDATVRVVAEAEGYDVFSRCCELSWSWASQRAHHPHAAGNEALESAS